jgi:uncharacterized membrane protein YjdF
MAGWASFGPLNNRPWALLVVLAVILSILAASLPVASTVRIIGTDYIVNFFPRRSNTTGSVWACGKNGVGHFAANIGTLLGRSNRPSDKVNRFSIPCFRIKIASKICLHNAEQLQTHFTVHCRMSAFLISCFS